MSSRAPIDGSDWSPFMCPGRVRAAKTPCRVPMLHESRESSGLAHHVLWLVGQFVRPRQQDRRTRRERYRTAPGEGVERWQVMRPPPLGSYALTGARASS